MFGALLVGGLNADDVWARHLQFSNLDSNQGLSSNSVSGIVQDAHGFVWIGTTDGLDRYDGYEVRSYRVVPGNSRSLAHNTVSSLFVDKRKRLWVGTLNGIHRYVSESDDFERYALNQVRRNSVSFYRINSIIESANGQVFCASENGFVYRFNETENRFEAVNQTSLKMIKCLVMGPRGRLWAGSDEGLFVIDPVDGQVTKVFDESSVGNASQIIITSVATGPKGKMWVGSTTEGLWIVDPETFEMNHWEARDGDDATLFYFIHTIRKDPKGNYWIGSDLGLSIYDAVRERFTHYPNVPDGPQTINAAIHTIHFDEMGLVWLGSNNRGVFTTVPEQPFRNLRYSGEHPAGLSRRSVSAVVQDDLGRLWVGFVRGGIDVFNLQRQRIARINPRSVESEAYGAGSIFAFHEDEEGKMWVGTYCGGVQVFDRDFNLIETLHHQPLNPSASLAGDDIRGIAHGVDGSMWFLCHGRGLSRLDPLTGQYTHFSHDENDPEHSLIDNWGFSMLVDREGNLWIGTGSGLSCWRGDGDGFKNFRPGLDEGIGSADPVINTLSLTDSGTLWIGTRNGLLRWDSASGQFSRIPHGNLLEPTNIMAIAEDSLGHLWCSTNKGIVKIDLELGRFDSFDSRDGLQDNEFVANAGLRSPNGELVFGGINGVTLFRPEQVQRNLNPPPVVLTEMLLFNQPVEVGSAHDGRVILPKTLQETSSITLGPSDDFFTLRFSALNFRVSEKNEYAYMLEGFDQTWIEVGNKREATYTNLNPGLYTFRVVASNNDGVWNHLGASLSIRVLPPFWKTWWFRLFLVLVSIGLIMGGYYWRFRLILKNEQRLSIKVRERTRDLEKTKNQLATHHQNLEMLIEIRTQALVEAKVRAEQSDRAKSTFLANMSHEIRTPMNAILGYAQLMRRDGGLSTDQRSSLDVIHRSGEHLLALINDVLEMSKIEAGKVQMNPSNFDLKALLGDLESMFRMRATEKGIRLQFVMPESLPRHIVSDEAKLRQILINIVGNALKFTEEGGIEVRCSFFAESSDHSSEGTSPIRILFEVEDTGTGIDESDLEHIFKTFTQAHGTQNSAGGTGLGLAISREHARILGGDIRVRSRCGSGSCFTVEIVARVAKAVRMRSMPRNEIVLGIANSAQAPTVLVVDDRASNRDILVKMLNCVGFHVSEARDGEEALTIFEAERPAIVLMDIQMPRMNGHEAIRRMRALEKGTEHATIIAVSAGVFQDEQEAILAGGADAFISKPFHESDVFGEIQRCAGTEYVYAQAPASTLDSSGILREWSARARGNLPAELYGKIQLAVDRGGLNEMRNLAIQAGAHDPDLSATLLELINEFDIKSLSRIFVHQRV